MLKFSIIIPIYNVEVYLEDCLNSVIGQSYKDFEILCIDDGSTDNSIEIIIKYSEKDSRIRYFRNEYNRGLSYARNVGIKQARGEYLFFLDGDDTIKMNTLEELYDIQKDRKLQLIYFDYEPVYENNTSIEKVYFSQKEGYSEGVYSGKELMHMLNSGQALKPHAVIKLYERKFLLKNNLFFTEGILHEDIPYTAKAVYLADRVYYTSKRFYEWHRRENSISTTKTTLAHIEGRVKGIFELIEFIQQKKITGNDLNNMEGYIYLFIRQLKERLEKVNITDYLDDEAKMLLMYQKLFLGGALDLWVNVDKQQRDRLVANKRIVVFGAGKKAKAFLDSIKQENIEVAGVIVTNAENSPKLCGYPICSITDAVEIPRSILVVVAVSKPYHDEIARTLHQYGFYNVEYLN